MADCEKTFWRIVIMKTAFLKHPGVILIAVIIGSAIGLYNAPISALFGVENFANLIGIPGQIYLFYLQMTVIPIIITAIASSLGKLMRNKGSKGFIGKIVVVFLAGIGITAVAAIVIGGLGKPGAGLDQHTRTLLTNLVSSGPQSDALEISLSKSLVPETLRQTGLSTFFTSLVPSNIFSALSQGSTMAVVFFSITFGIAIGFLKDDSAALLISLFSAVFEAFQKLVSSSLYLLPIGLICLMAQQIAAVGIQIFMAMSKFIILYCVGTVLLFIVSTIVIWRRSGQKNPFKVLSIMFEPVMLAMATRNSMATLPSSINSLHQGLGFDKNQVNLTLPLGMTLGRFGNIFYFGIGVFFVAQLYGTNLTFISYVIIFIGIILAGTATAGASGIVTISLIGIALGPLNLPVEAVLVIFMAIDPIIDPFRTLLLVYANIAVTTVVADRGSPSQMNVPEEEDAGVVTDSVYYPKTETTASLASAVADRPLFPKQEIPEAQTAVTPDQKRDSKQETLETQTPGTAVADAKTQRQKTVMTKNKGKERSGNDGPRPKTGFFGRFRVLYGIVFLNAFFLIVTAVIILSIMWISSERTAQELSESLIAEIQNSVTNRTLNYFNPVENVNKDLAFNIQNYFIDPIGDAQNRENAFAIYAETMRKYPQTKMVYYSDALGNLIMLNRMEDGSLSRRFVNNDGSLITIRWEHTHSAFFGNYPNSIEPASSGYDPRKRIWYTGAVEAKTMTWSPIYIFATGHQPGFTCAVPIYNAWGILEGISSMDISVSDLSMFLGTMQPTPGTRIVIIDKNENLVAIQARSNADLENLFETVSTGGHTEYTTRNINAFPDKTGREILKETLRRGDGLQTIEYNDQRFKSVLSPIGIENGLNLSIGIIIPEDDIIGNVRRSLYFVTLLSIGILVLIIISSSLLSKAIATPMQILSTEMVKVKDFQLDSEINVKTRILEIIDMQESFEGMRQGLKNFKRYVPSDLVAKLISEEINAEIGGEERELTMLFSDIANFTSISEKKNPDELVRDLCVYFENISKAIIENKGTIDKYIGDSVMAFWGAPVVTDNHAERACRSAVQMQQMLRSIFRQWQNQNKLPFYTRIGIHTGNVIVGNMGYEERLNYTVIGDHVNVASRLEGINKTYGTRIIVSQNTWEQCHDRFEFRMLDRVSVVGRIGSLTIYELYSEKDDIEKVLRKLFNYYETGLAYYFEQKWDEAMKYFKTVLKYRPHDMPSLVMYQRCVNYKKAPPDKEWNGIYVSLVK
jgi:adenylate cyclase